MKKYFKLAFSLFSLSSKRFFEHRWNTFGIIISQITSLAFTFILIEIYFSFSQEILGWTKYQVLFLMGFARIIINLFSTLFTASIVNIPNYIQKGDLDLLLAKPVNSQFFASFRFSGPEALMNILSGIVMIIFSLDKLGYYGSIQNWIFLFVGLILGVLILYSLYFLVATLSFWVVKMESLMDIYTMMREPMVFPIDIFGKTAGFILTFIIPLAFVVTIPVKMFFDKSPIYLLSGSVFFAVVLLFASNKFWNFGLKHYTSASS